MQIINMWSGDVVFEEDRPLPNEEYLIKYITELLSRLSAGERAIALRLESGKMVADAIKQAENLKCCGNCSHTDDGFECSFELPMTESGNCCDKWQSDELIRSEREIK